MIKNVIFDMGNVLINLNVRACVEAFHAISGKSKTELSIDAILGDGGKSSLHDFELGDLSTDAFLDDVLSACPEGTKREQVYNAVACVLADIPVERRLALLELRRKGYKVFLLSNTNDLHWPICAERMEQPINLNGEEKQVRIGDFFDKMFLSHEMHLCKPDSRIYAQTISQAGINPEETLYFDDVEANVLAGKSAGLDAHQVVGSQWLSIVENLPLLG